MNRRFFIYCSLACTNDLPSDGISLTTPGDLIDVIVYGTGKTGHFTHCANVFHVSPTFVCNLRETDCLVNRATDQ